MEYLLALLAMISLPLTASAKGNGPDISTVSYPTNITANISATLSANVTSSIGVQSCHLYVDSSDEGAMTLTSSGASISYTFPRGGVFTVFVFCRDNNGGMSSGPNTSILVEGSIVQQPIYSGSSGDSGSTSNTNSDTNTPSTSTTQTSQTTPTSTTPIVSIPTGSLIKLECPADAAIDHPCKTVYYYGTDLKRHAFPNAQAYFTWYQNFDSVTSTDQNTMSQIPLGKNITYRPGIKMVKFQTDNKVYTVSKGGVLRWITSEALATILYGSNWNKQIDDISDAFYTNYTFGSNINELTDYSATDEANASVKID